MSKLPFEQLNRTILVKKEAKTSDKFGINPEKRYVEKLIDYGIVNIDKPQGPTSHQVSAYVKQILKLNKAGHSGTLDPNVTGVLPVALGRSTKIVQGLLTAGKEYVCIMHLHNEVSEDRIRKAFDDFIGKIKQIPPLKSAVKRQEREREIYYIDILEIDGQDVLFKTGCQAGTYIRTLCVALGRKLGTNAHMAELRRTKAGPFDESTLVTLQDLQDAYTFWKEDKNEKLIRKCIQPVENAVKHLPKLWVTDYTVNSLCHGAALNIPGISKLESDAKYDETCAILTLKDELIAIGKLRMNSNEIMVKEKGIVVLLDAVFMEPGTYPKMIKK
ncbi:TPA: RNA-guided pseudouridylation complex pseudouridine synthase subunit Cbf5 [Candidatus Woesearchaeota archaeon]|nr:RNA-guided pseudouridylation complex pseudouridine synthase subunit Cbf5 [Candidatus Woesearchaeota archaeon]HIH39778.1 RNA-guided pseudouridylation complex pseudouridine synthase subunit Cbf5 [Candidatus Woesearchaeota archaeon]